MDSFVFSLLDRSRSGILPDSDLLRAALDCSARNDFAAAFEQLQRATTRAGDRRAAHFMLWEASQILGDPDSAFAHLREALRDDPVTSRHCLAPSRRILVLAVPGDFQANLPIDALLCAPDNQLHTLWLVDPEAAIRDPLSAFGSARPDYDCVFIAIAEDARHHRALQAADRVAEALRVPSINRGSRIAAVSRGGAAHLLRGLPDAIVPAQNLAGRGALADTAGLAFPMIIRPSGSHAGKDLARIDHAADLQLYLANVAADRFYIAPFVQYRSDDGFWRKYRIIFVDGQPWPYHLAIHDDWAIWYYNARMDLDPWKRQEEARFVHDIRAAFPPRAMRALHALAELVGLDYFGIDCGVMPDGRLVVFEIETGMIVHDWDCAELYPYKKSATMAIRHATEKMIDARIAMPAACRWPGGDGLGATARSALPPGA